ncbi:uncharacterized protein L969DRAFT_93651 [Mixia osmundae IAM 14324]|uniref:Uncharacterized protein n=1 Tax=Mixia osmundae (strain CBS 9802 / IAM 14324 / JCM 22182 / KY 12970) TaxID=764103 RepID=G7E970_MIXOS|nr:uncharacterized protein L969DRAFT_93651 [Mixia osmundae IAM 14324]KEI39810.1 hypothetical protein L969DRAFT_93651 [Mixia osmundae IAM 14324]GAA99189.1 hypothetical protein E5Q_05881 [Mixia osmundae IAM 14324]
MRRAAISSQRAAHACLRTRGIHSSAIRRAEATVQQPTAQPVIVHTPPPPPPPSAPLLPPKRPAGAFRGSIVGFLLGLSVAAGYGYMTLFEEYQSASNLLLTSVEELKTSTQKMTNHVRRIERVERDLKAMQEKTTTTAELEKLRTEVKKLYDSTHIETLDLKAHVFGIEKDLGSLQKSSGSNVRV